jgi:hypothetical protein
VRRPLTWVVVGVVGVIAILAGIDALRDPSPSPHESVARAQAPTAPTRTEAPTASARTDAEPIEACAKRQLALWAGSLGGGPVLELSNASGVPCRTPRLPIRIRFFDEPGENKIAATAGIQEAFAPTILSPGIDLVVGFNVIDQCGGGKPKTYVVEAGPYVAGARVPRAAVYSCLDDLGP